MTDSGSGGLTIALPSDLEIVMTREFAAPRRLVYEAMTRPEHLKRWWGPRSLELSVCEVDLRVGGTWRFVQRAPDGQEFGFHGVYREIEPPVRLVFTFVFDPFPEHDAFVTVVLDERNGRTTMTETIRHKTKEGRDGQLQSGMEEGSVDSMNRLEELLASLS
jgi:uncharacterized protein YndB with AHSA1/START domain